MKKFMGRNFLLENDTAKLLFHNYAEKLPIIDYHCHVSPKEIAEDRRYNSITELWLGGDHYKWRAMRSCGVDERFITGDASDYEKFCAYASIMPNLIGNPLYHWSHLELRRYFGINDILSSDTAEDIWNRCNEQLAGDDMSVRSIIRSSNVDVICTTDDPADLLENHAILAGDDSFETKVLPSFRPDKGINLERPGYRDYINRLSEASGYEIRDLDSLKAAYLNRLDFFAAHGCCVADHGIDTQLIFVPCDNTSVINASFKKALDGESLTSGEIAAFKSHMHRFFGIEYARRGWVMQLHYGVLRNVNSTMLRTLGPDTGFDIIGGDDSTASIASLLDSLAERGALPRMIIYPVNPADNAKIAALIGAFQLPDGSGMPKVMQGSAWWFNDNKAGMREQMTTLANMSAFGSFLGMLTDSRSFISYPRHEYFRRILCNLIGEWVENGEYPADMDSLATLVMNISYNNTKKFFGF